jgi:glucokinase
VTVVGVDLGGTKILAAHVDDDHTVAAREKRKTPVDGSGSVIEEIAAAVDALGVSPDVVGVGAPGPVADGVVMTAPNLVGWTQPVALREELSAALGVPVVVDNDATVGALGEWVAGAGQGSQFLLGVWLGTGVGGGLVLDGRPFRGATGAAGEFGHMVIRPEGERCGCGRRGCVEAYAGRASMERSVAVLQAAGRYSSLSAIAAERGKYRFTSSVWAQALRDGDEVATELLTEAVTAVGIGVASAVNLLDLDCVVVGGGLTEQLGQPLADRIRAAALPRILTPDSSCRFVAAQLADLAGVVGAAQLARSTLA